MNTQQYPNLRINRVDTIAARQSGLPPLFYAVKRCYMVIMRLQVISGSTKKETHKVNRMSVVKFLQFHFWGKDG